ncbi:MAG: hypothetical protein GX043_11165, partial [Desulfovibrionales bacterium]|nr:hypothetical protein [Desulfovibrionales bacterium]
LDTVEQCLLMKEAIFRFVLHYRVQTKNFYLSLAGGRKTMSADLQRAASFFGCEGLFHVVDTQLKSGIPKFSPEELSAPAKEDKIKHFMPISIGKEKGNPLWQISFGNFNALEPADYPITDTNKCYYCTLINEVEKRLGTSDSLLVNFSQNLMQEDLQSNFLALYRLNPSLIKRLKTTHFGVYPEQEDYELNFLRKFPKAELHCHLGGIADVNGLISIAKANEHAIKTIDNKKFHSWRKSLTALVHKGNLDQIQRKTKLPKELGAYFTKIPRPLPVVAQILAFADNPELLDHWIYGNLRNPEFFHAIGIQKYEKLGDLQGSTLLQSKTSLRAACTILKEYCRINSIRYLELRCSPEKYTLEGLTSKEVVHTLINELSDCDFSVFRLIFIASRHGQIDELKRHVQLALDFWEKNQNFIVGFDLAGDESVASAQDLRNEFMPLMEKCMQLTIHAGETMPACSIWEAIYHLSADRIGHGLRLIDDPELMEKVKDRRIALEMCPSSNFQIVGFRDNFFPLIHDQKIYPLKKYMEAGLRITINSDNPGISRTDLTRELHRACRLTPGGLSLWDLLILIRQGFRSIFSQDVRRQLLMNAEDEVVRILTSQWSVE